MAEEEDSQDGGKRGRKGRRPNKKSNVIVVSKEGERSGGKGEGTGTVGRRRRVVGAERKGGNRLVVFYQDFEDNLEARRRPRPLRRRRRLRVRRRQQRRRQVTLTTEREPTSHGD